MSDNITDPTMTMADMPQEVQDFMGHMASATSCAYSFVGPILQADPNPVLQQALGEVVRYSELATMYMERMVLFANMMQSQKEEAANATASE